MSEQKPVEIVDPDNVHLSADDLKRIKAKAAKMVADERKKALEAQALAEALEELRGKEGMRSGDPVEDEIVNLTIDVGESTDRIVVNGKAYFHGSTYPVPRHMARSLMEIMFRTTQHEHGITGKPMAEFYRKPRHTVLNRRGAVNAPVSPGAGLPTGVA